MPEQPRSLEEIAQAHGYYSPDAFAFVQRGLGWTVQRLERADKPEGQRHVTGQELCWGLQELALAEWGHLARVVLAHMNIRATDDFGKIVYFLIENQHMQKRPEDSVEDFHDVFDFTEAFDRAYRIELPPEEGPKKDA